MERVGEVVTPARHERAPRDEGRRRRRAARDASSSATRTIQLIDVLAGRLIDDAGRRRAPCASRARSCSTSRRSTSLGDRVEIGERRVDAESGREVGVVARLHDPSAEPPRRPRTEPLPEEVVRQWLLPAVYERLRTGRGEFLAELRPAYPLFVRFGGIDYDATTTRSRSSTTSSGARSGSLASYGGNLLQLTLGDKGAYLYAVFGSPLAHEDDAARAAAAALELRELEPITAAAGHPDRHHLRPAAQRHLRPRAAADVRLPRRRGQPLGAADVEGAAGRDLRLGARATRGRRRRSPGRRSPPMTVKGKAEPVAVFALTGSKRHASRGAADATSSRSSAAAPSSHALAAKLDDALEGRGSIVGICAEAGMGKSRLVAEFVRGVGAGGGSSSRSASASAYGTQHELLRLARDLGDAVPPRRQPARGRAGARARAELAAIDPALVPRAPLLGRRPRPARSPTTTSPRAFDAKLRKTSLEGLLAECLRARAAEDAARARARGLPLARSARRAICSRCSPARSRDAAASCSCSPTGRHATPGGGLGIETLPHFDEIALAELDAGRRGAADPLEARADARRRGEAAAALVELVTDAGAGQPVLHRGAAQLHPQPGRRSARTSAALTQLELPESLHSLILSRIDTLGEAPRRTLKVASVLGRVVPRADAARRLPGARRARRGRASTCERCGALDLVNARPEAEQTYLFKHVVTQEVAYESMPFAIRSMLHERVGGYIEQAEADAIERNLDLLAHHYWHSENLAKKREYLGRAGDAAQADLRERGRDRLLRARWRRWSSRATRVDVLLKLGKVLELVGNWRRAERGRRARRWRSRESSATTHARASCETALAEVARKQGRFDEAVERLDRAARGVRGARRRERRRPGAAPRRHRRGAARRLREGASRTTRRASRSASGSATRRAWARLLSNLGIIAEYRGDYDGRARFHERGARAAHRDRRPLGDRRLVTNLGDDRRAAEALRRGARLVRGVDAAQPRGRRPLDGRDLPQQPRQRDPRASATTRRRAALRRQPARVPRLRRPVGARVPARGHRHARRAERRRALALELVGAADALREAIGAPRAPSLEEEIERQLAPASPRCRRHRRQRRPRAGAGRSTWRPPSTSRSALCERRSRSTRRPSSQSAHWTRQVWCGAANSSCSRSLSAPPRCRRRARSPPASR